MAKQPYKLTRGERDIIQLATETGDWNIFTRYFFSESPGIVPGWEFDHKIDTPWQNQFHVASQPRIMMVGGTGCGKTIGMIMSAATWCATTHHFKFMNVAPTLKQAAIAMELLLTEAEGTPFANFIYSISRKQDDLKIVLKHDLIGESTLEFRSASEMSDRILGFERDWINYDEAGLDKNLGETIIRLSTRLRGTIKDRERLGRLSLITNPHVNPELWYYYDMAIGDEENSLSMTISARTNHNVTDRQLKMMMRDIPEDEHERWLDGKRPDGESEEYPSALISGCEDEGMDVIMSEGLKEKTPGFSMSEMPRAGVTEWALPNDPKANYIVVMDPGQGAPPYRNAPTITVWDMTAFPKKSADLRAFWWGNGGGSYEKCVNQFKLWNTLYHADWAVFDSTGTQTGFDLMFNLQEGGMSHHGWNLAGQVKNQSMLAQKMFMTKGLMRWPKKVKGIRVQHANYVLPDTKIAQDIVSNFQIFAGFIKRFYWMEVAPEEEIPIEPALQDRYDRIELERYGREVVER